MSFQLNARTPGELREACGDTPNGRQAFADVRELALLCRQRMAELAQGVVGKSDEERAAAKATMKKDLEDFWSVRDRILSDVDIEAARVGQCVPLDELCNFKV
jgi:uncharacterized protein with von Willebrand factor type A (vWA) domain